MPDTGTCDRQPFEAVEKARSKPGGAATMNIGCGPLATLAELVSMSLGTLVVDRTGLTGRWSATLYFARDENLARAGASSAPGPSPSSLPTALQEQLGLKLESTRGPLDVLVVDWVHPPTEN